MSMSPPGREEFLAEVRGGVLAIAGEDGAGPLAVPIWYAYETGGAVSDHQPRLAQGPRHRGVRPAQPALMLLH
jgi:nitroimidazol reductase NimA-like FMN-containing flavoprotein (pyridoxamine 5'-phosphate oxidase superfamily)